MGLKYLATTFTPAVRAAQKHYYGRTPKLAQAPERDLLTSEELEFISARDSFYMGTVTEEGWPYVQHRGGPRGFLKVLGPNQLGFADFGGNRQILSTGNLAVRNQVAIFLMDYPRQERLKLLGHVQVLDAREDSSLADRLAPAPDLRSKVERLFRIEVIAFDWNCSKYITPRYTQADMDPILARLQQRIADLEAQLMSNP